MALRRNLKAFKGKSDIKPCVECKEEIARYAGNNLCEKCWREFLRQKA